MKIRSRLLLSLLAAGLQFFPSIDALAARSYLVELVVFSYQDTADSESWTSIPPPLSASKMSRAVMPGDDMLLVEDNLKEIKESTFSHYLKRINADPKRRVLLSTHWVQAVLGPADTAIVRITDVPSVLDSAPTGMQDSLVQPEPPQIDGFINFYLDGYYSLEADIRFNPPYKPSILDEQAEAGPSSFRIHEKRRIKSGELNYYDHPRFGMVLLVTPVEIQPVE